jgi:hypothetical protein
MKISLSIGIGILIVISFIILVGKINIPKDEEDGDEDYPC